MVRDEIKCNYNLLCHTNEGVFRVDLLDTSLFEGALVRAHAVFQMLFALDKVLVGSVSRTLASELGVANGRTLVAFVRVEVRVPTFPTTSAKCKVKSAKCKAKSAK